MTLPLLRRRAEVLSAVLATVLGACGCAAKVPSDAEASRAAVRDMREVMLASAKARDRTFPDGKDLQLTQFAYIGVVTTREGPIRVAACRAVIPDMLSPRGQAWISFHRDDGSYIGAQYFNPFAPPLWCEGSKIYFFGLQGAGDMQGNALDLGGGFERRKYKLEPAVGSWTRSASVEADHGSAQQPQ